MPTLACVAARKWSAPFYETSAKLKINNESCFYELVCTCLIHVLLRHHCHDFAFADPSCVHLVLFFSQVRSIRKLEKASGKETKKAKIKCSIL
jgi:hypothetical protein